MDKEKNKNLLNHPLLISVFTCLCLLVIFSLRESSKKASISKDSIQNLEKSVELIEKEVGSENEKLKNSQEEISLEKIMRNELLLKKEGEIVLQIPDEEQNKEENKDLENKKNGPWEEWEKLLLN
jgi:hypothetical protein